MTSRDPPSAKCSCPSTVIVGGRRAELLEQIAGQHPGRRAARVAARRKEIQVERVRFLRYGEARGDYD